MTSAPRLFSYVMALSVLLSGASALAQGASLTVRESAVQDEKAVFATVESANEVPARARIGGTVVQLKVKQGDHVEKGQVVAVIGDQKLGMAVRAQDAQVAAARQQMDQAKLDLDRAEKLGTEGFATKARIDQLRTAYDVARNTLASLTQQKSIAVEQQDQGRILAPASGRVLTVPVTAGTVVMPGEAVATIAEQNYVLRLSIPERHAAYIKVGDPVRMAEGGKAQQGAIKLVYPKIENGRMQADANVTGVGDYFVGERVRVLVPAGQRTAIVIPEGYIVTRNGIDLVRWQQADGQTADVPVQRGIATPDGVEILSGLHAGDVVVKP